MKKLFNVFAAVLLTASVFAQTPEKMSYQAVIRDASNNLVTSQTVGMQISILQGSASGTAVYVETQEPSTNDNGLVSIEIGDGTVVNGTFTTIDWTNGSYFIKTETDPTGGTSYTITGTSQLLSVPYALHAKTAETVTGAITESDPTFTSSEAANITATDITNLDNLSGTNTGDQDLSALATKTALSDSTAQIRSEIPDVSGFLTSYTETDPVYTSSEAANITATDITNLGNLSGTNTGDQDLSALATKTALSDSTTQVRSEIPDVSGFLSSETDPIFNVSVASGITATDTTNWNNKLDSYTETDPSVPQGTQTGEMQYWDGTAWITVAAGNEGQVLTFVSGVPTWTCGTPPIPNVSNPATGKIWMDRNLGASQFATSSTDAASYGDLYQWGRAADGHQIRTSGTTTTLSTTDTPGHDDFIIIGSSPYDWRNPHNDNLWQGVSGTNNPCPSGYRLPTIAEWGAERASWSNNDASGAFASPLKLPVAGYRDPTDNSFDDVGSYGFYWSSTVISGASYSIIFTDELAGSGGDYRAVGFSVRCIMD